MGTTKVALLIELGFLKINHKIQIEKLVEFQRKLQMEEKRLVKRVIEESQHLALKNVQSDERT